jgi:GT2 family glycosyltransferase
MPAAEVVTASALRLRQLRNVTLVALRSLVPAGTRCAKWSRSSGIHYLHRGALVKGLDRFLGGRFTLDPAMPAWTRCASNNLSVRRRWAGVVGGWDEGYVGWGKEDMDFAYRLYRMGLEPVVLLRGPLSAMHIGHGVDEEAIRHALNRNAALLLSKFPEILPWRLPAYRHHELPGYEEDASATAPGPCP